MINLSPQTIALAQRLAAAQGISIEEAIKQAVEQCAREAGVVAEPKQRRDISAGAIAARKARMDRIADEIATMPVRDPSSPLLRLRHGRSAVERLWRLLTENEIEVIPFDEAQVQAAAIAFDRYGKGIPPKARLNLSDCAAYALSKSMNAPLLFKGNDFAETDLQKCL
jgi:ribonuclease VapC